MSIRNWLLNLAECLRVEKNKFIVLKMFLDEYGLFLFNAGENSIVTFYL